MKRSTVDVFQDGAIGGFIGYGLISLYFAALNVLVGKPAWYTVEALGNGLFGNGNPGQMIAFNGLHLAIFLALGVVAAFMIQEIELHPAFWYVVFFASVAGFIVGYVFLTLVTDALADLSPFSVAFGNAVAGVGMGAYLFWRHPQMARAVHDETVREDQEYLTLSA